VIGGAVVAALGLSYVLTAPNASAPVAAPAPTPAPAPAQRTIAAVAPAAGPSFSDAAPTIHDEELERRTFAAKAAAAASRGPGTDTAAPLTVWPARGAMTGWFGEGRRSHIHPGMDLDGETGDPVFAAGPGIVTSAGPAPAGYSGYGTTVIIDHGGVVTTLYAHLSSVRVQVGQIVPAGHLVGAIGTTGNVTGSHLHFEVRLANRPVDPRDWLPPR
jgi:murein DD-endopeptidase MepM/ murein hydrolase activator NlpD